MTTAEQQQDDQTGAMTEREWLVRIVHDAGVDETVPHVLTDPDVLADAVLAAGFTITRAATSDAVVLTKQDAQCIGMLIQDAKLRNESGDTRISKSTREARQPALDSAFEAIKAALAATQEQVTP